MNRCAIPSTLFCGEGKPLPAPLPPTVLRTARAFGSPWRRVARLVHFPGRQPRESTNGTSVAAGLRGASSTERWRESLRDSLHPFLRGGETPPRAPPPHGASHRASIWVTLASRCEARSLPGKTAPANQRTAPLWPPGYEALPPRKGGPMALRAVKPGLAVLSSAKGRKYGSSADPDGLPVRELDEPVGAQFAAESAVLRAAEGDPGVRLGDPVHEHRSGFDLRHEPLRPPRT